MKSSPLGVAGAVLDAPRSEPETDAERKHVYVETYGCQMNVNDSEVMLAVLKDGGYDETDDMHDADVILVNTCAIREKAEAKIWQRLAYFKSLRKRKKKSEKPVVGVLGCMAERLKTKLLEADQLADLVAGPDAYRDLPNLISAVNGGEKAMNVQLSVEETYADIVPVRKEGAHAAFVTIMRGCDNACAFCIVPYTRGRERSRDPASIEYEVRLLSEQGVKEVTLLGQNVNSYAYSDEVAGGGAAGLSVHALRRERRWEDARGGHRRSGGSHDTPRNVPRGGCRGRHALRGLRRGLQLAVPRGQAEGGERAVRRAAGPSGGD